MIMFIVAAATAYGFIMTRQQIPNQIADIILRITDSPLVFLYRHSPVLILGTLWKHIMILIATPMLLPIVNLLNIDPLLFGVIMVSLARIRNTASGTQLVCGSRAEEQVCRFCSQQASVFANHDSDCASVITFIHR